MTSYYDLPPEQADPATAGALLLPVEYDATASWLKGTAGGPSAILEASQHVETLDLETGTEPCRRGIAGLEPIRFDGSPEELAAQVCSRVDGILDGEQLPVVLGGEHSVSIGAVEACADRWTDLSVLQIDAHADTRETYQGSTHSHACVMARARERCAIVQVGLRAVDVSEMERLEAERVIWAREIAMAPSPDAWIARAVSGLTESVYVTIDVDAFDPAFVPATGTPEPGGMNWYQVNALLAAVARNRRVVGFDVVELLPGHAPSSFLAAKLIYRFLAEIWQRAEVD